MLLKQKNCFRIGKIYERSTYQSIDGDARYLMKEITSYSCRFNFRGRQYIFLVYWNAHPQPSRNIDIRSLNFTASQ